MKVLHVLRHSVPTRLDGYAIRSHAILRAQQSAGVDVCALTGSYKIEYPDEKVIDGVRYLRTASTRLNAFGLEQLGRYYVLRKRLREVIADERPDVIHVHSPVYNGLAALAEARRARIPLVYEVRALWEDAAVDQRRFSAGSVLYRASVALESNLLRQADAVVTICDGLKAVVVERGADPRKVFVAPNGVDTGELKPRERDMTLRAALGLADGLVIGFIGSLFSFEGVEDLLDVIPEVLEVCPNLSFLIIGSGERQATVAGRSAELGAGGRLVYRSRVPHNEVPAYYSLIDCLVYPRRSVRLTEVVTPLKPLEAMAMQKAVIGSNVGGHRELIRHGETGILYQAQNRTALSQALCAVASDAGLRTRLAAAGRKYAVEERQWGGIVANHFAAYDSVLAAHEEVILRRTS